MSYVPYDDTSEKIFKYIGAIQLDLLKECIEGNSFEMDESSLQDINYRNYLINNPIVFADPNGGMNGDLGVLGDLGSLGSKLSGNALDNKNAWMAAMSKYNNVLQLNKVGQVIILANVMVESGNFKWFHEIGNGRGRAYGRPAGPYKQIYYGRGPLQVTWYDNYKLIYEKFFVPNGLLQYNIVKDPDLALNPTIASCLSIGWLCCTPNGKKAINAANNNKLTSCRRFINGGTNGLAECKKYAAKLSADFNVQINLDA